MHDMKERELQEKIEKLELLKKNEERVSNKIKEFLAKKAGELNEETDKWEKKRDKETENLADRINSFN